MIGFNFWVCWWVEQKSEEVGVHSTLNAIMKYNNSAFGYLNNCIYREGIGSENKSIIGKVAAIYFNKKSWYSMGVTVTLFLSALRKNYEVVLSYFIMVSEQIFLILVFYVYV